jgi:hypothetical protein
MSISAREKRVLVVWVAAVAAILAYRFWPESTPAAAGSQAVSSVPLAERRLTRNRELAGLVPGRQKLLSQAEADLALREKGILQAETAAQAQAQLVQMMKDLAKAEAIEVRNTELGQVRPLGDAYGEIPISLSFESTVDAMLNLLTKMTQQKELIATDEIRIGAANPKQKTVLVRLTVTAVVARKLVPEKKALGVF